MTTLEFRWTTSRGRDTYGYNICSLYVDGRKVSSCNGGGYDMKGTALGDWIERAYVDRLLKLTAADMEEHSHWEPATKPGRYCDNPGCSHQRSKLMREQLADLAADPNSPVDGYVHPEGKFEAHDWENSKCPHCGGDTTADRGAGRTVQDGRYFYGLSFHDPDYDPGKAIIGTDCQDRTLSDADESGKTVEQAEAEGKSFGLERLQAFYARSSKVPSPRHCVPSIDGACGISSVQTIMRAIGLQMEWVPVRSKKLDVYVLHDSYDQRQAA